MLSREETGIIDLTADLSDLEPPSGSKISSAKKRARESSHLKNQSTYPSAEQDLEKRRRQHGLLGVPFASTEEETHYRAVRYGGMLIEVDSMVTCLSLVNPKGRPSLHQALVRRIVEKKSGDAAGLVAKLNIACHVQWLFESPCGGPNELFLKHGDCQDIKLSIVRSVTPIHIGSQSPVDGQPYIRHVFHHAFNIWRDPKLVDVEGHPVCDSCCPSEPTEDDHHLYDCVFLEERIVNPGKASLVWRVARIVQVDGNRLRVQLFERFSDWAKGKPGIPYISEKRLLLSFEHRKINRSDILGKAKVLHEPASLKSFTTSPYPIFHCQETILEDRQIVPRLRPLPNCDICTTASSDLEQSYKQFLREVRLPAIDYYSGGGGGMIGAKGFFKHQQAVELNKEACKTLKQNFPKAIINCETVAKASTAAKARDQGRHRDDRNLLPRPGSIVLATAGPPCQGHTGANHQNRVQDSRNDELFVTIDEVKRLRPDIFILENVPGMKSDRGQKEADQEAMNFAVQGIRGLRDVGYQVRMVQLDSRSFGSPQNRTRLFLICARKGVTLPSTPVPTHANPALKRNIFVSASKSCRDFYVGSQSDYGSAPFPAVTVRDAICDLPRYEYRYGNSRPTANTPAFDPRKSLGRHVGFFEPQPYGCPAKNDYQSKQRDSNGRVEGHYTPTWTPRILDIIFTSNAYVGQKQSSLPGNRRRVNPDRGAATLLTDSIPGGKSTGPIHYDQRRTLTVAERKRIQGVPDAYHLCGTVEDNDRQIGNMINVDLSRALHGHIHREIFFKAWLEMGKPDNFLERWRASHPV